MYISDFNDGDKIFLPHFAYDRYFTIRKIDDKIVILDECGNITTPNIVDIKSDKWRKRIDETT